MVTWRFASASMERRRYTHEELEQYLQRVPREAKLARKAVAEGRCPHCDSTSASVEPYDRQSRDYPDDVTWYDVRCPDCGLAADWMLAGA